MAHWTLNDIPWQDFDASKVRPEHLSLAKAACMVEHNGDDYARYLCEVFHDDEAFKAATVNWAKEEVQHGMALRRWVELADPSFDFGQSFSLFTEGYKLPTEVSGSVRGSRCGELIARCVVETGTSTYYTAIKESTEEPVLKAIAARIAADEFRHYQLFYTHLKRYQRQDKVNTLARLRIALGRVLESDDDELAFAFFSSHHPASPQDYERQRFFNHYMACVCLLYDRPHVERMTAMILKAVGLKPHGWLGKLLNALGWHTLRRRARSLAAFMPAQAENALAPA